MPYTLNDASDFANLVRQLRNAYSSAGDKEILTPRFHNGEYSPKIGFSYVGSCPLEVALRKEGVKASLPKRDYSYDVMDRGNYTSPMYVEPFVWEARKSLDMAVLYECFTETEIQHGYMDMVLNFRDEHGAVHRAIVEIKDSDSPDGAIGTPKIDHCLQLIGYAMATGETERLFLLIQNKRGFRAYQLVLVEDEDFGFMLYDDRNESYVPDWGDDWNHPRNLNRAEVERRVGVIQSWIPRVRDWQMFAGTKNMSEAKVAAGKLHAILADKPFPDPLNERGDGWRCIAVLEKAKIDRKTKPDEPGRAIYNCQYAGLCHGVGEEAFEFHRVNGRYVFPHEIEVKGLD